MEMTAFWFGAYKLLKYLLYPYTWVVLLLLLQIVLLVGRSASRRLMAIRMLGVAAFGIVTVLGHPLMEVVLVGPLESRYPPFDGATGKRFDAIVVLSGGVAGAGTLRPQDDLGDESRSRTLCGVQRYREGLAPRLLLSGGDSGIFGPGPQEALLMKRLALQLGVPEDAILIENRSRTTYENAVETRRHLGTSPILLVTSASHMPRAMALFEKQSMDVTASPCWYLLRNYPIEWSTVTVFDFIPTADSLDVTTKALNEWAGMWIYRLAGKI